MQMSTLSSVMEQAMTITKREFPGRCEHASDYNVRKYELQSLAMPGCVQFCGDFCVPSSTGGLASAALVVVLY